MSTNYLVPTFSRHNWSKPELVHEYVHHFGMMVTALIVTVSPEWLFMTIYMYNHFDILPTKISSTESSVRTFLDSSSDRIETSTSKCLMIKGIAFMIIFRCSSFICRCKNSASGKHHRHWFSVYSIRPHVHGFSQCGRTIYPIFWEQHVICFTKLASLYMQS